MKISFARDGWEDYTSWVNERSILKRINRMIEEAARDPGTGIGKPERLSNNLAGLTGSAHRSTGRPGGSARRTAAPRQSAVPLPAWTRPVSERPAGPPAPSSVTPIHAGRSRSRAGLRHRQVGASTPR